MSDISPRRARLIFIALWAMPLSLMGFAWLVYLTGIGLPAESGNHGVLIQPPAQVGEWLPKAAGEERWTLLIAGRGSCDSACRQRLWFSRQIHIGLGRAAWRLRRVYWGLDGPPPAALADFLRRQHPGLQPLHEVPAAAAVVDSALGGGDWPQRFYVVDPRGFLMMAYDIEVHEAKDVLEDLRFLLKTDSGL